MALGKPGARNVKRALRRNDPFPVLLPEKLRILYYILETRRNQQNSESTFDNITLCSLLLRSKGVVMALAHGSLDMRYITTLADGTGKGLLAPYSDASCLNCTILYSRNLRKRRRCRRVRDSGNLRHRAPKSQIHYSLAISYD